MGVGNAFNTALGGLNAFATQVGYISDNLANVSTPGFKEVTSNFQSYVTESTPTFHNPGGVTITPSYQTTLAGQINSTATATNFSVSNGNGFIPVAVPTNLIGGVASFNNAQTLYTRAGDFTVNNNGYLVNSAGNYLLGVKEQTTYQGNIPGTPSLGNLTGVRVDPTVYKSIPGVASTTINYNANFPAGVTANAAVPTTTAQVTSQVQFYDSLGTAQTLQIVYQKTSANTWVPESATIPSDTTVPALTVAIAGGPLTFNTDGSLATPANGNITFTPSAAFADGASANVVTLNYGAPQVPAFPAVAVTPATGSTQYAGSALEVRSVTDTTGQAPGTFQSASVDNNGYVVFSYTNGQQKKPYRVPLVSFSDATKLQRITGATFAGDDTLAGPPIVGWSGQGQAGTIAPSAVEESNVDIATELTKMIVAQRAYSSNGKVITTSDQMFQDTLQLVR